MAAKLLIVEDEQIINDYLYTCLAGDGYEIYRAYNGLEAMEIIKNQTLDLILSDIIMPQKNGFDLLMFLKEYQQIPVIMITALADDDNLLKAYELGVVDYLTKPLKVEILTKKVNNILTYLLDQKVTEEIILQDNYTILLNNESLEFTKTEYELFTLLYQNLGRIYTKENLIDLIWHGNYAMSEKVIEVNIFNIRKKLGHFSQLIKTKRGVGYYFENQK